MKLRIKKNVRNHAGIIGVNSGIEIPEVTYFLSTEDEKEDTGLAKVSQKYKEFFDYMYEEYGLILSDRKSVV